MNNLRIGYIGRTMIFLICVVAMIGCSNNEEIEEISYFNNPHVVIVEDENETDFQIGKYNLEIANDFLYIKGENVKNMVRLPDNLLQIKSFHLSPGQHFLVFDAMTKKGMKIFFFNVALGEKLFNLSDKENHYQYNNDTYVDGYGIAWAPNGTDVAIITGYPYSATVSLFNAAHHSVKNVSFSFLKVQVVKWDRKGDAIYYVVDTRKKEHDYEYGQPPYLLYKTEIDFKHNMGTNITKIRGLSQSSFDEWLQKVQKVE
jgi:hypothetical protein